MKTRSTLWRKVIGVSTALILSLTLMTACGSSSTDSSQTKSASASASQVAWNYVSPSDLTGDSAKAESEADTSKDSSDKNTDSQDQAAADQNGESSGNSGSSDNDSNSDSNGGPGGNGAPSGQPPEKPDGKSSSDGNSGPPSGQPPEMPGNSSSDSSSNSNSGSGSDSDSSGNGAPSGQPPEMANGDSSGGPGGAPGGNGGPGGGANTASYDYDGDLSAALNADGKEVTSDGETIEATDKDQNAALAQNGGSLEITGATISKSGSDEDGDNTNFYGINSSVLSTGEGSKVYLSGSSISSDSAGSNGVFATDSGEAYVNSTTITTKEGGNSRGLDATYGGVIYGNDLTISTEKDHCAALATDRGGGYISVTNSELNTAGSGSPLIYSTGDIEVDNVTGTASGSQIAGMEGINRIVINNSNLSSTNDAISGSDPIKNGVILYQSTSGDADTASSDVAEFEAVDSNLSTTISDGSMFYVTNTSAKIVLQNTNLDFDSDKVSLLYAAGNDSNNWGSAGSNGGTVTMTGIQQTLNGDVYTDEISSASLYLTEGSTWTGTATGEGNAEINVDGTSTWTVTDSCTIKSLNAEKGAKIVDADGNQVTIVSGDKTLVEGNSDITVTVSGDYGTEVELTEAQSLDTNVLARDEFDSHYDATTKFGTNN